MKNIFLLITAAMMLLSCSQDETDNKSWRADDARIAAKAADFEATTGFTTPATRTALTPNDKGLAFTWSEGDILGVFSKTESQQVPVYMSGGADSKDATFSSKGFQLAAGEQYVAYYPIVDKVTASPVIPVDYTGQTQDGNGSYAHLASHDYMVSDAVTPTATNVADFAMHHVGAILRLRITMPKADSYSSVVLSATSDKAFTTKADLNLFGTELIEPTEQASTMTLNLTNAATTDADKVLTVWAMVLPTDLSSETVTVTVKSATGADDAVFSFQPGKKLASGKAYSYDIKPTNEEYVDLGLTSGNLWATCNIGASTPEEYGTYYAWGADKFISSTDYAQYPGFYPANSVGHYKSYSGNTSYDTATKVLGGKWITPDQDDWIELINNSDVEWTTQNGVNGMLVTGPNGKSIFLPAAGYYSPAAASYKQKGEYGRYWSSELKAASQPSDSKAANFKFHSNLNDMNLEDQGYYFGCSVRPIMRK